MSLSRSSLRKRFMDSEEYRYAFAEDFLNTKLALQILLLRENRGIGQRELAKRIGTKQAGVSRIENANYSAWNVRTLKKVARGLGVRLSVSFESFASLLGEAERMDPQSLIVPAFENDPAFQKEDDYTEPENVEYVADGTKIALDFEEDQSYPLAALGFGATHGDPT